MTVKTSYKKTRITRKNSKLQTNFLKALKQKHVFDSFSVDFKIWIFIPVYNFSRFLNQCFESIKNQTYKNINILVIDDCSDDSSLTIINSWANRFQSFELIANTSNMGPGYTKWQAIQHVVKKSDKCDIFTILDGDDKYSTKYALEIIVDAYLTQKCWMTYGSSTSQSEQSSKVSQQNINTIRKNKDFNFAHPRTCLCFLLNYVNKEDFIDHRKQWIVRATECMLIFKLLQLSGIDNIYNIQENLHFYRNHANNVRKKIDDGYKKDVIKFISNTQSAKQIEETIHIVMCVYKRHENLETIIESINNQSCAKQISLHIINTNSDAEKWAFLKSLIKKLNVHIKINLCNTNKNLYGYARFLYVKYLLHTVYIPYVIFIDDDQKLAKNWVERMYESRKPLSYNCWYGRVFKKYKDINQMNYFADGASSDIFEDFKQYESLKEFDYGGTGGCIIDTNIFRFNILFRCPKFYRNIEDLWLSFIVKQVIGGKINIINEPIKMQQFNNQNKTALCKTIKSNKTDFLQLLMKCGYLQHNGFNINRLENLIEKDDSSQLIDTFTFT